MKKQSIRRIGICLPAFLILIGCGHQETIGSSAPAALPSSTESVIAESAVPTETSVTAEGTATSAVTATASSAVRTSTTASDVAASSAATTAATTTTTTKAKTHAAKYPLPAEMRGVWVSFYELDDLLKGATPQTAAKRLDTVMDTCVSYGLNTVFFHVRANSDAYYASSVFPAAASVSPLLAKGFDPLEYAVRAAHARGLALHAWINPYRVGSKRSAAVLPDVVFQKGGKYYYDPSEECVRKLVLDGIREILIGYDVDGIHFDDYFYPSAMSAVAEAFETVPAGTAVGDWRRTQVDTLVSSAYGLCHLYKRPFGISPSAVVEKCRNELFADVAGWMSSPGYLDYICPQIYFGFNHQTRPFSTVLAQWGDLPRLNSVSLYVGLALYKATLTDDTYAGAGRAEWASDATIIARQVDAVRNSGAAEGFVLYCYDQLTDKAFSAPCQQMKKSILK